MLRTFASTWLTASFRDCLLWNAYGYWAGKTRIGPKPQVKLKHLIYSKLRLLLEHVLRDVLPRCGSTSWGLGTWTGAA